MGIKKYPDPILRKKCEEVQEITQDIKNFIGDMIETMEAKEGIGLAAPQVGVLKKIIIVRTPKGPSVFVNPKIVRKSRETEMAEEGCLSLPEIYLNIRRARAAEIEAIDIKGKKIHIRAQGTMARVFQHEIDHIESRLMIDRLNFLQKLKIRKKLKKIKAH